MIRVYLDWNIIRKLQEPKEEKYTALYKVIMENKGALLTPFSNYHVEDILHNNKTEENIDKYVKKDLAFLEEISQEQYLGMNKDGEVVAQIGSPLRFLENIDFTKVQDLVNIENMDKNLNSTLGLDSDEPLKALLSSQPLSEDYIKVKESDNELIDMLFPNKESYNNMWDMVVGQNQFIEKFLTEKIFYKNFRRAFQEQLNLINSNQGNWEASEVIPNIDEALTALAVDGYPCSFKELLEKSNHKLNSSHKLHNDFISAYVLLDMLGYQADKLEKSNNDFFNIQHDAVHSYLGSYCDIVVSEDERFLKKTKVVYSYFGIPTEVLNVTEFLGRIEGLLHSNTSNEAELLEKAVSYLLPEKLIIENNPEVDNSRFRIYKLENYMFNYFNYLIVETIQPDNVLHLKFRRAFKNNSWFVYYLETKNLLIELFNLLGLTKENQGIKDVEEAFIYNENNEELQISWVYNGFAFCLEKETNKGRDCFNIFIALNKLKFQQNS